MYSHNIDTKTHPKGERRIEEIKRVETYERTNFVKKITNLQSKDRINERQKNYNDK